MLALLGMAVYALKHAEIPTAWHPVFADQDARDAAQNLVYSKQTAVSPGWWLIAPRRPRPRPEHRPAIRL
jgi:hypothetical protein